MNAQKRHIRYPKVTSYGLHTRHSYGIYKEKVSSLNVLSVYTYIYIHVWVCMHVFVPASVTWLYETKRTEHTKSTRLALLCSFSLCLFYCMLCYKMKWNTIDAHAGKHSYVIIYINIRFWKLNLVFCLCEFQFFLKNYFLKCSYEVQN